MKVLNRSGAGKPDAAREGEAAARLAHANIATLYDAGVLEGGAPYLVYELLHGETLESRLGRGPLPPREALEILARVGRALVHAHAAGVVHRDLKPANVFLTADGEVKVLDFGVALLFGRECGSGGTPAYMAPEQRRGEPEDARTDLYALGLLLSDMLRGRSGEADAGRGDSVSQPVRRVSSALLAEEPASRPRSARVAVAEIEAAKRAIGTPGTMRRRLALAAAALLVLLAAAAAVVRHRLAPSTAPGPTPPSIAILSFADLSPGKDQEYFADGLSDEILNALGHVEGLRVAGRSSSFAFKGKSATVGEIGRALHVGSLLEGSVRKEGQRVRVTAQVVNTADGYRLWSETFDRELTGIFAVQDEIARAVVRALAVQLLPGGGSISKERRTANAEAYNQYLLGRHFFDLGSIEGYRRAVDAFEKAIALDPGYAPAWAWLATALYNAAFQVGAAAGGVPNARERALAAADKAVALAPDLSESNSARGWMRLAISWDWSGAQRDLDRALALSPRDPNILVREGYLLAVLGRFPEAIAITRKAAELDPLYPWAWFFLADYYNASGRPDLARDAALRTLELAPDHALAMRELGVSHLLAGDARAALEVFQRHPWEATRLSGVAIAHHDLGNDPEAAKALDALRARFADRAAFEIATVYARRGDRDSAFEWLDRSFAHRNLALRIVKITPLLSNVRDDPRYPALLRKMNLPAD